MQGPHNSSSCGLAQEDNSEKFGDDISEGIIPKVSAFCLELIEQRQYKGRTPLHFATRVNHVEHAGLLLDYGADVDSPDQPLSRTPVLLAIYWNHHEVLALILSRNARTDVVDARRCTILHHAARFADAQTLGILSEARISGISPNCTDCDELTPL